MLKHTETKILPYKSEDVFSLVADIEKYPEFLPWCVAARIVSRNNNTLEAELVINFKAFTESYTSRVELHPKTSGSNFSQIKVEMIEGPFSHLNNYWKFTDCEDGCEVRFEIDFGFNSVVLEKLVGMVFDSAARKMVRSFEERAGVVFGVNTDL